jgi:peptidoglycan hydrolase-like protein with peptidoglycan-binding domain
MPLHRGASFASLTGMRRVRSVTGAVLTLSLFAVMFGPPGDAEASSAKVAALQAALKYRGLYPIAVDGMKGPYTTRGVRRFQRRRHLLVDGIAGPQTKRAIGARPLGSRMLHRRNRGWDVAALQFRLQKHGYPPGGVDGVFGPGTHRALTSFQSANGLTVDGIAGPATVAALRGRGTSSNTPTTVPVGDVRFFRPVPGPIGDGFGAPRAGGRRHAGIDFPVAYGTRVGAGGVGTVIFAGWNTGGYGNLVVVQHRLGYTTWYAHLSRITSYVGEPVSGGTRVGYVGSTGYSTGPHLHFEVRKWNTPVDPMPYLLSSTAARVVRMSCADPDSYAHARIDACRPPR